MHLADEPCNTRFQTLRCDRTAALQLPYPPLEAIFKAEYVHDLRDAKGVLTVAYVCKYQERLVSNLRLPRNSLNQGLGLRYFLRSKFLAGLCGIYDYDGSVS